MMTGKEIADMIEENSKTEYKTSPNHYSSEIQGKKFSVRLTPGKLRKYAEITAEIYLELSRLIESEKVTSDNFKNYTETESEIHNLFFSVKALETGGFLCTPELHFRLYDISGLMNVKNDSPKWKIVYRPMLYCAVFTTAEFMAAVKKDKHSERFAEFKDSDEEEYIFTACDFLLRGLLNVHSSIF